MATDLECLKVVVTQYITESEVEFKVMKDIINTRTSDMSALAASMKESLLRINSKLALLRKEL